MRAYRELLGVAGVLRLTGAVLLSRLSTSMFTLSVLVATTGTYGYAQAGLLMLAFAATNAVLGPVRGRLADRWGARRLVLWLLAGHLLAYGGLLAGLATAAPAWVVAVAVVALGASVPPTGPVVRGLWPHLVPADRLPTAYAFDAALNSATFVSGPVLAGGLLFVLPAYGALAITGCVKLAGDTLVALAPVMRRHTAAPQRQRGLLGPLAVGRVRLLLAMIVLDTVAFGSLEVTAVAATAGQGSAGLFTAALALGAVVSGIGYGARTWPGSQRVQLVVLHATAAVLLAAGSLAGPHGIGLAAIAAVFAGFGLLNGPVETLQQVLIGELSPPGQRIEAFAWVFSVMWAGFGIGTTVAGQLAAPGTTGPMLLAAAVAQAAVVPLAAVGLRR
ncbi:MFS transporter [Actinophytocola xanthii]|uniref:MFS transporter n=1 Tax=Actinophytocola xanthii TaxID=1912961 RepID=A0A1Q8CWB1_9PSEU|nr:MFS transporter [Actinophytocola xanthii]OLF18632.1 hypothetical protein BU204_05050 [Actinophytocola xanthii]